MIMKRTKCCCHLRIMALSCHLVVILGKEHAGLGMTLKIIPFKNAIQKLSVLTQICNPST